MTKSVTVAVVGYGYWGPNVARNFAHYDMTELVAVCELSSERCEVARRAHPNASIVSAFDAILDDSAIEAVAIATPTDMHYDMVLRSLLAGKHVFVEKPLTASSEQAYELVSTAAERDLVLHVDHTFVYTPAVEKIREIVASGELGDLICFDAVRVNLGLFQPDVNVVWDLAIHDLSIVEYVTGRSPKSVSATGARHPSASQTSVAFLSLSYDDSFVSHIDVSWVSPVKVRRTLISGTKKMLVWDDLEPIEKLKVYDSSVEFGASNSDIHKLLVSYRTGDMRSPRLSEREALQVEVEHFARAVRTGSPTRTNGALAASLVAVLEAACLSIERGGSPVDVVQRGGDTR